MQIDGVSLCQIAKMPAINWSQNRFSKNPLSKTLFIQKTLKPGQNVKPGFTLKVDCRFSRS